MNRFHVSLGWRTDAGTLATAGLIKVARDEDQAASMAVSEIKRDRRHRFARDMQCSVVMLPVDHQTPQERAIIDQMRDLPPIKEATK